MSYNSSPPSPKQLFPFKDKCMQNYCKELGGNIPAPHIFVGWSWLFLGVRGAGKVLSVSGFGVLSFYTNQNGIVVCCPAE